jgi:hypothetical protein
MVFISYIYGMKKYICKNCTNEFESNKGCKSRTPSFCSKKCSAIYNVALPSVKEKMSIAKIGKTAWNKGVKMWEGKEHPRGTLGKKGMNAGRIVSDETREKLRISHTGLKYPKVAGENHWNWQNGKTPKNEAIRKCSDYRNWRLSVFTRDKYTCQTCGIMGGKLQADHIKPFSIFYELRFDITNGRTLCKSCHEKTDTYGGKMIKYASAIS